MSQPSDDQRHLIADNLTAAFYPAVSPANLEHYEPVARAATEIVQLQAEQEDHGTLLEVVTFRLKGESYALEAQCVYEVMQPPPITIVPRTPEFLQGVINLRGEILAVFDFNRLFGLGSSTIEPSSRLIVLGESRPELAFVADAVEEVRTIYSSELTSPTAALALIKREVVRGVTAEALVVLDGRGLLADQRLIIEQRDDSADD